MAATIHNGLPSDLMRSSGYPTPSLFTPDFVFDENHNVFESSFKDGSVATERGREAVDPGRPPPCSESFLRSITDSALSPFFSLPAHMNSIIPAAEQGQQFATQSIDQAGFMLNTWNISPPETNMEMVSPMDIESTGPSSVASPSLRQGVMMQPLVVDAVNSQAWPHGQVTPPSDSAVHPSELAMALPAPADRGEMEQGAHTQAQTEQEGPEPASVPAKRKRGRRPSQPASTATTSPPKRRRKSTVDAKPTVPEEDLSAMDQPEDEEKRNRFLERNRVAASKCRQKKKEWTNNLEARARKLQNENGQLTLMVGSLKDEVLFLKSEMLKHSDCDCDRIRQYLNQEADMIAPVSRTPHCLHMISPRNSLDSPTEGRGVGSSLGGESGSTECKGGIMLEGSVVASPSSTAVTSPVLEDARVSGQGPLDGDVFAALKTSIPS